MPKKTQALEVVAEDIIIMILLLSQSCIADQATEHKKYDRHRRVARAYGADKERQY